MQIHQLLASLEYGDAVANQAIAIQRHLRAQGHESDLFAPSRHPLATEPTRPLEEMPTSPDAVTLYHHAFWSEEIHERLGTLPGRLAMIYHNITPEHYFAPYSADLRWSAARARAALDPLRSLVDIPLTVSEFNRAELSAAGYADVGLLPLPMDVGLFSDTAPDPAVVERYSDGWTNFLFVGRLAPNKRQEDVIRVFAWYHRYVDRASRLLLVGAAPEIDAYREDLVRVADSLGVADFVVFAGKVSFPELVAYYRVADLFLCMSEHEGFCAPLVEAIFHDLLVVARAEGAIPETLGDAGILVHGRNVPRIAETIGLVLSDAELRRDVVERQRQRLEVYTPQRFGAALDAFVRRVDGST
ncbi:MAG: glycosyltransferase [Candidatus Binatia bacterium]|nr:glycosyltransferase [Candidatus Binatia bacterium]